MNYTHRLLEDNIKLKKENKDLSDKFDTLLSLIDGKLTLLIAAINQLANQPSPIQYIPQDKIRDKPVGLSSDVPTFIPGVNKHDMKINAGDVMTQTKTKNLHDVAKQLSKLSEKESN